MLWALVGPEAPGLVWLCEAFQGSPEQTRPWCTPACIATLRVPVLWQFLPALDLMLPAFGKGLSYYGDGRGPPGTPRPDFALTGSRVAWTLIQLHLKARQVPPLTLLLVTGCSRSWLHGWSNPQAWLKTVPIYDSPPLL